jgi:hypothetical protein
MNISNLTGFLKQDDAYNLTCGNFSCHLIHGSGFSFENLSIFIALLTGLIIYTHFFGMIREDPYLEMKSETRKKYFWFFENIFWIALWYTGLICLGVGIGLFTSNRLIELFLFVYAWLNILLISPISENFKKYFDNYENIEKFNEMTNDTSKLPWYKSYGILNKGDVVSTYIFLITLEFAYLGYLFDFNILSLIFVESTFILIHIWVSRLNHIPQDKHTIELTSGSPLKEVYIIEDITDEYYIVISKEIGISKVMKSSIKQIFVKSDNETDNEKSL